MTLQSGWVPVALTTSIEPGSSAGAVVNGAEIVVWRDSKSDIHVWEDRCPHRGMRMSFGFVRGDQIACLYHGWAYDTGGQCQHIPAHPDLEVPKTIKIPTYAVEERDGIVWTCLSEDADVAGLPETGGVASPVRSLYADCAITSVATALSAAALPDAAGLEHSASVETVLGNCFLLTAGTTKLLVACQPVGPAKTALHLSLIGQAPASAAELKAIARWAEGLRRSLEQTKTDFAEVA
jgi:nitrite reductase/ring-hydroxylating ferredoxin subunit